jgi:hypothetical protein
MVDCESVCGLSEEPRSLLPEHDGVLQHRTLAPPGQGFGLGPSLNYMTRSMWLITISVYCLCPVLRIWIQWGLWILIWIWIRIGSNLDPDLDLDLDPDPDIDLKDLDPGKQKFPTR